MSALDNDVKKTTAVPQMKKPASVSKITIKPKGFKGFGRTMGKAPKK